MVIVKTGQRTLRFRQKKSWRNWLCSFIQKKGWRKLFLRSSTYVYH